VITDEPPSLQTLWQYAFRFRVEDYFGQQVRAFELQESHCVPPMPLNAYTSLQRSLSPMPQGMAVQLQVPHWRRGISYLADGVISKVLHKGRELLTPIPLPKDPQPCFASSVLSLISTRFGSPAFAPYQS